MRVILAWRTRVSEPDGPEIHSEMIETRNSAGKLGGRDLAEAIYIFNDS